jgi:hypothetical protein
MFTKQHFIAIAKVIKGSNSNSKDEIAKEFAELFQSDNERFDIQRFLAACGVGN